MSNQSSFTIDVFDYVSEEEDVEEYGERLYISVPCLVKAITTGLENHPSYKDYTIEVCGVKRWEW